MKYEVGDVVVVKDLKNFDRCERPPIDDAMYAYVGKVYVVKSITDRGYGVLDGAEGYWWNPKWLERFSVKEWERGLKAKKKKRIIF